MTRPHRIRREWCASGALLALVAGAAMSAPAVAAASSRPRTPTLHVSSGAAGTSLTWSSGSATGFTVEQATNAQFSQGRHTMSVRDDSHQLSPYGLVKGRTYYFRVQARSGAKHSAYSKPVTATVASSQQPVRVMTYNILEADVRQNSQTGKTAAPWSKRRAGVVHLIKQGSPDVVGIEEAAAWVKQVKGPRQIDDLVQALGGEYALARTEVPPSEPHYHRTGVYILYKPSVYEAVGNGGNWDVGNKRWAVYQVLENRQSGARFLFVNVHLMVGGGRSGDHARKAETTTMMRDARQQASLQRLPIIYAGDYNSHVAGGVAYDGPGIAMRAAHVADAFFTATSVSHAAYDSANGYQRRPPKFGHSIDHIYAPAGVAVRSWGELLDLSHGHFVGTIPSDHNPVVATLAFPY